MGEAVNPSALDHAIANEEWDRVEEVWLEALDAAPIAAGDLLAASRRLRDAGQKNLAATLVELLAESLELADDHAGALAALTAMVREQRKPAERLLERLENAFLGAHTHSPSVREVVNHYRLRESRRPLDDLEAMTAWLDHDAGTIVEVVGQGVGRVVEINLELENVKVDVGGRRPVSVPFGAVSRFIRRLPEGDFLRRKVEEPEVLARFVAEAPGDALVALLDSLDGTADVAAIKAGLDGVLPPAKWTSWWSKARKHPRVVSSGSGSRLRYELQASAESAIEALLDDLRGADARDRLVVARRLASRGDDAASATARFLAETLEEQTASDPGLAWETAAVLATLPGGEPPASACRRTLVNGASPQKMLAGIGDRSARLDALEALREATQEWSRIWGSWFLHEEHPANLDRIAHALEDAGAKEMLENSLEAVFRNHLAHPAQLVWACEAMSQEECPEPVARRMTASVLEILPDALSRPEYSAVRGRAKALLDRGQVALRLLLEVATPQQASRFEQRVVRLSGVEPDRVRLVEQAAHRARGPASEDEVPVLAATRAAVEARQSELKRLVEVDIPKTLKGIQAAAAEGDLRENFEYHMLRDRQELQSARAAKLQQDLGRVRIIEPGAADTSKVNVGTVVDLESLDGVALPPLTILGPWDADVDRRIFADGSELAQSLLGRTVGDQVEIEGEPARITAISSWMQG